MDGVRIFAPVLEQPQAPLSLAPSGVWREAQLALWNALKIGGSLVATWSVALAVRFLFPRALGPELYGVYNFTDAFAASFFVLANLGIETYAQKEIPVRPAHASDFVGGLLALRLSLSLLLLGAMAIILHLGGRPGAVQATALLFGAGQFFFLANATFAALLQARGEVGGLSLTNVATKVLWGSGMLLALARGAGVPGLALAFALAELVKALSLWMLCRRHLALELRIDAAATRGVVLASLPFFVTTVTTTLFGRLDDTLMGFFANDREVGFFGLASNLSQVALLLTPLLGAVLLPLFSRVAAQSLDELGQVMRRSLEVLLMLAIPASLLLGLGADVWVLLAGGPGYAPAALALRILSPVFVVTYVAMLCADTLYLLGRSWKVTCICLGGLVINGGLNALLIRPTWTWLGPGGAGVGAALATIATETFTCALFVAAIGRRLLDARLVSTVVRLLGACAATVALDRVLTPLGPPRLLFDAAAYGALAVMSGGVRLDEIRSFAAAALESRRR